MICYKHKLLNKNYKMIEYVLKLCPRAFFFLYTGMQNPRSRTVYRQRKWPLLAPVRKIFWV